MNILPIEEIPENLQLSNNEILEERCKLIEGQIKILTNEIDTLKTENDKYKKLVVELYIKLDELYTSDEDDEDDEGDESDEGEKEKDVELEEKQ